MSNILKRAFYEPFQSPERVKLYIASIIGSFGFSGLMLYLAFDFAKLGAFPLLAYFSVRFAFTNLLWMPLLLILVERVTVHPLLRFVICSQIISFLLTALFSEHLITQPGIMGVSMMALLSCFISAPFWMTFHTVMLHHSSDDNKGNDVAISEIGISLGAIAGFVTGGIALALFPGPFYILLCFLFIMTGTIILSRIIKQSDIPKKREPWTTVFSALYNRPWLTANTIMHGIQNFLSFFFAPVWLKIIGLGSISVGAVTSLQMILKFILSPIAGHWTNQNNAKETLVGSVMNSFGWLPWLILQSPWLLVWSSIWWNLGNHMFNVGLNSRWYQEKTMTHMAAREICLGIGRLIAAWICIPALFVAPHYFFITAAIMGVLMVGVSAMEGKSLRAKT